MASNLYVHFPFCRRKCTYCALHSRVRPASERDAYARRLAAVIAAADTALKFDTIYFGGGSPALADLGSVLDALAPRRTDDCEFTVELHPLDVKDELLKRLVAGGVNRISMGVQSLDDAILDDMGRGHTFAEAERAFYKIREHFENAGIDLIVGYPGESAALLPRHARLAKWGLSHCSVYSLILEERSLLAHRLKTAAAKTPRPADDETVMNRLAVVRRFLADLGLERYEISSFARPGRECRHNLAVWRGEDYFGLGEGAHGRIGLRRTKDAMTLASGEADETVTTEFDRRERRIFTLRTRDGLDPEGFPEWEAPLGRFVAEGLLRQGEGRYYLTERGAEVCDTILAELV